MRKQLRRWSHGFMQNVQLHWNALLSIGFLRSVVGVALWESTVASIIYLGVVPLTAILAQNPLILLVYVLDAPALMVPVLTQGRGAAGVLARARQHPVFFRPPHRQLPVRARGDLVGAHRRTPAPRLRERALTCLRDLPGMGVGTLFYVLMAFWMPIREIVPLLRGRSSAERWRQIGVQLVHAVGIIGSVALADRLLVWMLDLDGSQSTGPARWIHEGVLAHSPQSLMAAPIMASLLLLAGVLLLVELVSACLRITGRGGPSGSEPLLHKAARRDARDELAA